MTSTSSEDSCSSSRRARLHILRLHESPIQNNESDYERFSMSWVLVDDGGLLVPKRMPSEEGGIHEEWKPIQEGDIIFFPELLSGGGEFEGMRFVGKRLLDTELRLLKGGIESPIFPREIFDMQVEEETDVDKNARLRSYYEEALEGVVRKQDFSLNDIFGGDVEEFWKSPDIQRQNERRLTEADEWKIPLDQCTWLGSL